MDERLQTAVYDQLRRIARQRLARERPGHSLQATALVHEAWLRLARDRDLPRQDRTAFYAAASLAMQRILVEHARARRRLKRGGSRKRVVADVSGLPDMLDRLDLADDIDLDDVLAFQQAIGSLAAEDPRAAEVTRLRFYAGLTVEETAEALDVSPRTVMREWTYARAWLHDALGGGRAR